MKRRQNTFISSERSISIPRGNTIHNSGVTIIFLQQCELHWWIVKFEDYWAFEDYFLLTSKFVISAVFGLAASFPATPTLNAATRNRFNARICIVSWCIIYSVFDLSDEIISIQFGWGRFDAMRVIEYFTCKAKTRRRKLPLYNTSYCKSCEGVPDTSKEQENHCFAGNERQNLGISYAP